MSRVEDDRQADQIAQRLLQEKQRAEAKTKQAKDGENAFSKLVQQSQTSKTFQTQQKQETKQSLAQQVLARVKDGTGTEAKQQEAATTRETGQRQETGKAQGRQEAKNVDEHVHTAQAGEAEHVASGQAAETAQGELMSTDRAQGREASETRSESRASDAKSDRDTKAGDRSEAGRLAGRSGMKGDLKADADSSGGQSGGGNKDGKQGGEAAAAAGFRFNPALMAPVPVAQPKASAGSDRLRAIANEIAQKIVERVRVGTNGAGAAEFQIDLRSNVLNGLSIKLSAKNGKIQAVFSGKDRDVLKMIEEQSEGLKSALQGRGLKLENLRFEVRA
ncbi:flagellar hook-length control protein FliK [Hyalangium versicolor]|uniref:flagellar hook-length control protein FliK n=1 Tax=Hyalangium versicolor TaxID=2861190 RepID=UPI001CCD0AA0|nr:flagellar hook-length control protein FliK [Hyalangium versicolor]